MLVEFGGDIKIRTNRTAAGRGTTFMSPAPTSFSPLLFAVRAGAIDATKALLEAGANVNDVLSDGESALIVAVANSHWELASFLLDKGADPNLAGAGWNALHQAVRERRPNVGFGTPGPIPTGKLDSIAVIKKMIAHGADVNARMTKNGMKDGQRNRLNRLGATPFFLAAKVTDVEAMRVLVAAGANPLTPNADGTTPLMVAAGLKIWNPGEDGGSLTGQEDEVLEAVKMCVELGNDVNAVNSDGETALHGVAFRGVNAVAQYLVDKGAKLDAKDVRGWTPLFIANGIDYSDFFKQQTATADLLRQLMKARGISTEGQVSDGTECLDCIQTHADQIRALAERDKKMEAEFSAKNSGRQQ
jgi:ankyrin repeat protein